MANSGGNAKLVEDVDFDFQTLFGDDDESAASNVLSLPEKQNSESIDSEQQIDEAQGGSDSVPEREVVEGIQMSGVTSHEAPMGVGQVPVLDTTPPASQTEHKAENKTENKSDNVPIIPQNATLLSPVLLTPQMLKELWPQLAAELPKEAIQTTDGEETSKNYDTAGYKYQYIFNRLNEILPGGPSNWRFKREPKIVHVREQGKSFDVTMYVEFQIGNTVMYVDGRTAFYPIAEAVGFGGCLNKDYHHAVTGAFTNAFKKVIAELGPGNQAYTGELLEAEGGGDRAPRRGQGRRNQNQPSGSAPRGGNDNNGLAQEPQRAADKWPILPFGKYQGKSLLEIYRENPGYVVEYLADKLDDTTHDTWRNAITKLVEHHQKESAKAKSS